MLYLNCTKPDMKIRCICMLSFQRPVCLHKYDDIAVMIKI